MSHAEYSQDSQKLSLPDPQDAVLLGYLVRANSQPNGWRVFLEAFCEHFGLMSCHLHVSNVNTFVPQFHECGGVQPSDWAMKEYVEKYIDTDYTHVAAIRGEPHQWYATNLMPNYEEVHSAPAKEWSYENGIGFLSAAALIREGDLATVMAHNRELGSPAYTQEEMLRLGKLSPYIEQAMRTRINITRASDDASLIQAALNKMPLPVALLNEFSELVAVNSPMQNFIDCQPSLQLRNNKYLQLTDNLADKTMRLGLSQAIAVSKEMDLSYDIKMVPVKLDGGGEALLGVDAIVENTGAAEGVRGGLVYIVSPNTVNRISENKLQALFGLTATEARVCAEFIANQSPQEIAYGQGKSLHTVREQLKSVFEKAGVTNQIELLSLLASLPL